MERREDEDERVRVRRHDEERDHREREERPGVAGERFLRKDGPPWEEPVAGHEPAERREDREPCKRRCGPVDFVWMRLS